MVFQQYQLGCGEFGELSWDFESYAKWLPQECDLLRIYTMGWYWIIHNIQLRPTEAMSMRWGRYSNELNIWLHHDSQLIGTL